MNDDSSSNGIRTVLDSLRNAAEERNPEQTQFLLKKLLLDLDYYVALAVALEPVYEYVPIWESYYPDETWIRTMLVSIANFGTAPDEDVAFTALSQDFHEPGAGNYVKAIADVVQAMQGKHAYEARVGYMVSAVVNAIMAKLVESWYGGQPDEIWERVRKNQFDELTGQFTDSQATQIAYQFWTDDGVAKLDRDLWLAIADSVEDKFRRIGQVE